MDPDILAARRAALAHLGYPPDTEASWEYPAAARGLPAAWCPPGWVLVSRQTVGPALVAAVPEIVRALPPALRIVTAGADASTVYTHGIVAVALRHQGLPPITAGELPRAMRHVETPGTFAACVAAAAVGGWGAAAQVLRELIR